MIQQSLSEFWIGCEPDGIALAYDQSSHSACQNFTIVVAGVRVADPTEDEWNIPGIDGTMRPIGRYESTASCLHITGQRFPFPGFKQKQALSRLRIVNFTPIPPLVKMPAGHEELFADATGMHRRRAKADVSSWLDKLQNVINDNVTAGYQDCINRFLILINATNLVEAFRIPSSCRVHCTSFRVYENADGKHSFSPV